MQSIQGDVQRLFSALLTGSSEARRQAVDKYFSKHATTSFLAFRAIGVDQIFDLFEWWGRAHHSKVSYNITKLVVGENEVALELRQTVWPAWGAPPFFLAFLPVSFFCFTVWLRLEDSPNGKLVAQQEFQWLPGVSLANQLPPALADAWQRYAAPAAARALALRMDLGTQLAAWLAGSGRRKVGRQPRQPAGQPSKMAQLKAAQQFVNDDPSGAFGKEQ